MSAADFTVEDMLNSMSDAEFAQFARDNREKIELDILFGTADWAEALAEYQQAVCDGQAEARHQDRVFQESKGVLDGR